MGCNQSKQVEGKNADVKKEQGSAEEGASAPAPAGEPKRVMAAEVVKADETVEGDVIEAQSVRVSMADAPAAATSAPSGDAPQPLIDSKISSASFTTAASSAALDEDPGTATPAAAASSLPEGVVRTPGSYTGDLYQTPRFRAVTPEFLESWEKESEFTEQQNAVMLEFRTQLKDEGLLYDWLDNKPMWYRFCQARQWDVPKAMIMVRDTINFRKENGLLEFVDSPVGPTPKFMVEFQFPELRAIKEQYRFIHHKLDKGGRPVYFDQLGSLNYSKMMSVEGTSRERILQYFIWYSEATWEYRLPQASLKAGKYLGKGMYIMDLNGFGLFSHFTGDTKAFIKAFIKMAGDNYPETIYKTWIINAPFSFRTAWAFVKPFIDPRTQAKFTIMGGPNEYEKRLKEILEPEDIPVEFGGEDATCDFLTEHGPHEGSWDDAYKEEWPNGGCMPSPYGPPVESKVLESLKEPAAAPAPAPAPA